MTKAEEFAYSIYQEEKKGCLYDLARNSIIRGYEQAEKDLALTWEDVEKLYNLICDVYEDCMIACLPTDGKEYYEEVLKRFLKSKNT